VKIKFQTANRRKTFRSLKKSIKSKKHKDRMNCGGNAVKGRVHTIAERATVAGYFVSCERKGWGGTGGETVLCLIRDHAPRRRKGEENTH